jgi:ATP-dependent Clp protease ATP-binding subunit ClpA
MESLKSFFRPEFLNRLDEIIVFDILSSETIRSIVGLQVEDVTKRLRGKEIALSVSDAVLDYLAKEGYDPKFGARPLKRVIQSKILTPVANMMIQEGMLRGGTVRVDMKKDELSFDVKKKALSRSAQAKKEKTGEEVSVPAR